MKKLNLKLKNNRKGITLIALVITIIVLLILAGVTIAALTGDNGILAQANKAKEENEKAEIIEQIKSDIVDKQIENSGNISDDEVYEILQEYGTLKNDGQILIANKGNYEIYVSDIYKTQKEFVDAQLTITPIESWQYVLFDSDSTIVLKKYIGEEKKIFIPSTFMIDGKTYDTKIGNTNGSGNSWDGPFATNTTIEEVKFGYNVKGYSTSAYGLFYKCSKLVKVYNLPENYLNLGYSFGNCTSLKEAPTIPANVTSMNGCFTTCPVLEGNIYIESKNVTSANNCFDDTANNIILNIEKDSTTYTTFLEKISQWGNVKFAWETPNEVRISCWGDSLTAGAGGNGTTYPKTLQQLIGNSVTVTNLGVGGENSNNIAMRQGGIPIYVEDFTIPASTNRIEINIISENNSYIAFAQQGTSGLNPCYINDVEGNITYDSSTGKYYFTRTISGSEKKVDSRTQIITNGMKANKGDIIIIWAGTNDTKSIEDTITNIDAMLEYNANNKYIIIGLTYKNDIANINQTLQNKYGEHFLDIRSYILSNGLSDAGINPTQQDLIDIENGNIPSSLRYDNVHFNAMGYNIIAQQLYNKLSSLGYITK